MAGRAGRRGKDTEGLVYIFFGDPEEIPDTRVIRPMLSNKGEFLLSKFRVSYETVVSSFSKNNVMVRDLISQSFSENKTMMKLQEAESEKKHLEHQVDRIYIKCECTNNVKLRMTQNNIVSEFLQHLDNIKNYITDNLNKSNRTSL